MNQRLKDIRNTAMRSKTCLIGILKVDDELVNR